MEQWQQIIIARGNSINLVNDSVKIKNAFYEICEPTLTTKGVSFDNQNDTFRVNDTLYKLTIGVNGISITQIAQGYTTNVSFLIDEKMQYEYTMTQKEHVYERGQLLSSNLDYKEILNKIMNILL